MKNAIFIHGFYAKDRYYDPTRPLINFKDYTPWLLKQLSINDILASAPSLPKPYFPVYEDWKKEFERCDINEDTTLIGQSFGGGFLVRWLSETDKKVGKVFLVAPYINPDKDDHGEYKKAFFDFAVDRNLADKTKELVIFQSTNDEDGSKKSYQFLSQNIDGFRTITLENRGHFTTSTAGAINETFPELLEEILK